MTSGIDPEANYFSIEAAAEEAAAKGAQILFTPEMATQLDSKRKRAADFITSNGPAKIAEKLANIAVENKIDIALGSMAVEGEGGKWANRSMYFSRESEGPVAPVCYDKIHMFDVELATGETWRESNAYEPGKDVVTVEDTPIGRLGLAICYDLRFPALFEALGARSCDAIAIPAAFTAPTGKAHWHVMMRARAIEASAYVVATAQVGKHEDGRETYGHSLVVDPWGDVILDMGGEGPGLGFAEINLSRISEIRSQLPSLANRRKIPN